MKENKNIYNLIYYIKNLKEPLVFNCFYKQLESKETNQDEFANF